MGDPGRLHTAAWLWAPIRRSRAAWTARQGGRAEQGLGQTGRPHWRVRRARQRRLARGGARWSESCRGRGPEPVWKTSGACVCDGPDDRQASTRSNKRMPRARSAAAPRLATWRATCSHGRLGGLLGDLGSGSAAGQWQAVEPPREGLFGLEQRRVPSRRGDEGHIFFRRRARSAGGPHKDGRPWSRNVSEASFH